MFGRAEGPDSSHDGRCSRCRRISVQVLDDEILESAVHGVVGRRGGDGGSAAVEYIGGTEVDVGFALPRGIHGKAARAAAAADTDGPNQLGLLTRV